jgi:hypothetical protein
VIPFDVEQQDTGSPVLDRILARLRTTLGSLTQAVTNDRLVDVTFSAVNTDVQVFHGLGFPPVSWEVVDRDAAVTVWRSTTVNSRPRDTIILRASAAPLTVRIRFAGQQGPKPFPPSDIPFTGGPSGTPSALARYWLSIADASLPNAVDLGALGNGILYQTVAAGISTPAIVAIGDGLSFTGGTLSVPSIAARFWVSEASADLANEVNLGALGNGTLQHTVTAGVSTPTTFAGTTGSIPFYAANSQLAEHASLTFNAAGGHLLLGNDLYFTRAGASSLEKQGSGGMFIGSSVVGGALSFYTVGGSLVMDAAGVITAAGATGLVYTPATNTLIIGTTTPFAAAAVEVVKDQNSGTAFAFVNPNAGGAAYTAFFLAQHPALASGATFGTFLFSSGSTFGLPYGPNIGLFELAGGAGNMHFWIQQNAGDFVWYTKPTFPSTNERMRLTTAGVLSVSDLGAAGTGRLVKAAVTTGLLSIASASDVAGAITWPAAGQVLFSSGTTTAPIGEAGFTFIAADNLFAIGAGYAQGWFNLGNDGSGTFEEVAAFWSSNVFNLKSLASGGTVRPMSISADTATLTLAGAAGLVLSSTSFTMSTEVGGSGTGTTINGNDSDSNLTVTEWIGIGLLTTAGDSNSSITLDWLGGVGLSMSSSPRIVSATPAVDRSVTIGGSVTFTGTTTVSAYHLVYVPQGAYAKGDAGAVTITDAATVYIQNHPIPGTDVTITNRWALWVDGGKARFDGDGTNVFELPADTTANATGTVGRIPVLIGGTTRYLRYYAD